MTANTVFQINTFYIKQQVFQLQTRWSKEMSLSDHQLRLEVNVTHEPLENDQYEVILHLLLKTYFKEKQLSTCHIQQAGLFTAQGFSEEQLSLVLNIHGPQFLYPYARERIANSYLCSGLPEVILPALSFEQLFHQKQQQGNAKSS